MIAAIKLAGFTKYVVNECTNIDGSIQAVPYDIQVNQGGYVFDIIKQLRDILPNYQVYFDVNGVFHYDLIPGGDNVPVLIDDTLWNDVNMSDNITTDFESVKNYIEVYGKSHTVNYFPSATSVSGGTLNLTIAGYTETAGNMIGFVPTTNIMTSAYVKVNNGTARKLVDSAGNGVKNLDKDVYYVAVYQSNNTYLFLGHQQAQAIATDDNPESPFYVDGSVGMIRQVLSGGDYDNIMSDELALQRAKLEIYWKCRLNDSIALTCIPIPWVDVNILVSHAPKNSSRQKKYMVKSFNASYGDNTTMTINAISYYAYYSPTPKPEPEPEPIPINYIQSTGTQYIDSGVVETADTAIDCSFDIVSPASDYVFGSKQNSQNMTYNAFFNNNAFEYNYVDIINDSSISFSSVTISQNVTGTKNKIVITDSNLGAVEYEKSIGTPQNETILICAIRKNDGSIRPYGGKLRIKYFKIKQKGELIRDFTPCKNPSGEVGLYDYVTKAFYGNAGGGSLPDSYTELEYLQSSGTQYIDTGFKPNNNSKIVTTLQFVSSSSGNKFCFGARTSNNVGRFSLGYTFGSGGGWFFGHGAAVTTVNTTSSPTDKTSVVIDKNVCTIAGQSATATPSTFSTTQNLVLFADNEGGKVGQNGAIKLYDCSIYDNGTLVRNFVPARNSSGAIGLYDTVNGIFYTNAGSGTFTAGADIVGFTAGAEVGKAEDREWQEGDVLYRSQWTTYLDNVQRIRDAYYTLAETGELPAPEDKLGYAGANTIEKVLADIDLLLDGMKSIYRRAGTFSAGGNYVRQMIRSI